MGIARFDDLTVMEPVDLRTRQRIPPKRRITRQGYGVVQIDVLCPTQLNG